jgi:hypothetical protein
MWRRNRVRLALVLLGIGTSSLAQAAEVLYARSNGDWKADSRPGKYSALNILDGKPKTVWCSAGTGQDAWIEIQLDQSVSIDRVALRMGNQSSPGAFRSFNRIKTLHIAAGDMTHPMQLDDSMDEQRQSLDPVAQTDRLVLRLKAGYRGTKVRHSCIADVILYSGRRALNGPKLAKAIRQVGRKRPFLDTWVHGPQLHPTHRLMFGINDRFWLQYVPHDPTEQAVRESGAYRIQAGKPEIRVDRNWVTLPVKRDDAGRVLKLKVDGLGLLDGIYARRGEYGLH